MFTLKRFRRSDSGVAAIEMAFILPFMMILFFGLIDVTGLVSVNRKITSIASSVADLVGQNRTKVLKTSIEDYFKVVDLIAGEDSADSVRVRVLAFRKSGTTINRTWIIENEKGPACSADPDTSGMADLMEAGNDLIVAQTCTKFKPFLAEFMGEKLLGGATVKVEQTITLRPRSTLTLACEESASNSAACPNS